MHDAYEVFHLIKQSIPIEAIAAYDDNLLLGTKNGHLLMYSISLQSGDSKHDVQLLRYNKNFSRKPIQQLEVVPAYQILICLSDNVICVHDMNAINFPILTTLNTSRGASLFSVNVQKCTTLTDTTSVLVRMCVAVKRKILLFYWKNGEFLTLGPDITVKEVPRAMAWLEETICVGFFKGDYCLVELKGKQQELFPIGKQQEPSIVKLSSKIFALGKDSQTIFMGTTGQPAYKHQVRWNEIPSAMAYDEPYLLAVLSDGLEVRTVEPNENPIQVLPLQSNSSPRPRMLVTCRQGLLYLASSAHVWCIQAVALQRQIPYLLEQKQFQLALKLANISDDCEEDRSKRIYQIQTLYAHDLFNSKKFHESMKEFLQLGTDPYDVIRLFPDLLPQQSRNQTENESRPKLHGKDLETGLQALIEFLTEVRLKLMSDKNPKNNNNNNNNNTSPVKSQNMNKSTQQLLQIIDTTLLKCYLQTNDALVAPLLRLNHCHLTETEKTLKKYQKHSELIILYQTKGLHNKALELLQKQADQPDSNLFGYERTLQYLQHLGKENINLIFEFAAWVLERQPEEGLRIFTEDIHEVEQLPRPKVLDYLLRTQKNLVIPYLEHVIHVWEDSNPIFHNALVHQYREKYVELLQDPETVEERRQLRNKLLDFLDKSDHYTPETVLVHFPYDSLYEERAIVLGKLERHEQALSIYISVLGDIPQAMKYCEKVYNQGSGHSKEVYVLLMKMLVNPPESWLLGAPSTPVVQPDLETALSLLEQHAGKINPLQALAVLPDRVPLVRIKRFLETSLQNMLNERRRSQVLKGLLYAEHLQVQEMRMNYESQSILMTEFNVCPVCKKRFGNQSAFARYPNGDIVHYSCQDRRQ